jgi:uncharacterized protein YjcR
VLLSRGDRMLSTAEAAALVGVSPATIRAWRRRPLDPEDPTGPVTLEPQGLDERGHPVHTSKAVRAAERAVRERGIDRGGYDPRRLRGLKTSA